MKSISLETKRESYKTTNCCNNAISVAKVPDKF